MRFDFPTTVAAAMLVVAVVVQIWATVRVRRDAGSSSEQKGLQLRLIWFLPLLGAALVLAVLQDDAQPKRTSLHEQKTRALTSDGDGAGKARRI